MYVDAWKQSKLLLTVEPGQDPRAEEYRAQRTAWTYQRAAGAMLVTSLTTATAFMTNIVNAMIPIQLFGIFMGPPRKDPLHSRPF